MENQNYTATLLVDETPKQVFEAINNVRGWWSENIEGSTDKHNEEYIYRYKDVHYCKIKVTELVPYKKVTWQVLDNYFKFTKDQTEWIGTTIVFDISQQEGQTQLIFTHVGLVNHHECYEICRDAWTGYLQNSLRDLITTGKGQPNAREEDDLATVAR